MPISSAATYRVIVHTRLHSLHDCHRYVAWSLRLDDKDFDVVIGAFESIEVAAGTDVITQGDKEADKFYCVGEGECQIIIDGNHISDVGTGRTFGELALLYDSPRAATVHSPAVCRLWGLDRVR